MQMRVLYDFLRISHSPMNYKTVSQIQNSESIKEHAFMYCIYDNQIRVYVQVIHHALKIYTILNETTNLDKTILRDFFFFVNE